MKARRVPTLETAVIGSIIAIGGCVMCARAESALAWIGGMALLTLGVGLLVANLRVSE